MGRDEKRKRQDKEGKGEDGEGKQQAATPILTDSNSAYHHRNRI